MMDVFLKKLIATLILFSLGILILVLFVRIITILQPKIRLNEETKFVVIGHSHPEVAFNDALIDNFVNLSRSSESYFYTYQKIKKISKVSKIDTVFIEYTNNLIDKDMDEWIWGYAEMQEFFPLYWSSMDFEDLLFLYDNNLYGFLNAVRAAVRYDFFRIISFDFIKRSYGGYVRLDRANVKEMIKQKKIVDTEKRNIELSFTNIQYLEKIVEHLRDNAKSIIMIETWIAYTLLIFTIGNSIIDLENILVIYDIA